MIPKRHASPASNLDPLPAVNVNAQAARRDVLLGILSKFDAIAATLKRRHGVAAIHEARVLARRLRALLGVWRKECQPLLHAQLQFDLRDFGRALAASREADVRRQLFTALVRSIHGSDEPAVQQLLADLDQVRAAARQHLRSQLRDEIWGQRMERIHSLLNNPGLWAIPGSNDDHSADARQFAKQLRRLNQELNRKNPSIKQLHALRIAVKTTRYFAEALHELGAPPAESQRQALRQLQNLSGELHDSWQLDQWLDAYGDSPTWKASLVQVLQDRARLQEKQFGTLRRTLLRKEVFRSGSQTAP